MNHERTTEQYEPQPCVWMNTAEQSSNDTSVWDKERCLTLNSTPSKLLSKCPLQEWICCGHTESWHWLCLLIGKQLSDVQHTWTQGWCSNKKEQSTGTQAPSTSFVVEITVEQDPWHSDSIGNEPADYQPNKAWNDLGYTVCARMCSSVMRRPQ